MNYLIKIETITLPIGITSRSPLRSASILIALLSIGLWLVPDTFGVTPAPGGGYANNNTALGTSALFSLTSGIDNTALGFQALYGNTTGNYNTGEGFRALYNNTTGAQNTASGVNALITNTTGGFNTADGVNTLFNNTTGAQNTAVGVQALFNNTTAANNTANGFQALYSNTTGYQNTAIGSQALYGNTTGYNNTANGYAALDANTTGYENSAHGNFALFNNTSGTDNTAFGFQALYSNTVNSSNTAFGAQALYSFNTVGFNLNTAIGYQALYSDTSGYANTAIGGLALSNGGMYCTAVGVGALALGGNGENTAVGYNAGFNISASQNVAIGNYALSNAILAANNIAVGFGAARNLSTGSYNIDIGNDGVDTESGIIRLGTAGRQTATFIAGITGTAVAGSAVVVDGNGQLGVLVSSERFKDEIKPMDQASETIFALKPVTFHYKHDLDPKDIPQFGLIAEEVEKVNPNLVTRDGQGKIFTVRYEAVNAMLLNEFLKEHGKVHELEAAIAQQQKDFQATAAEQQKEIKTLTATLKEQALRIQKVSDQFELSKHSHQMADNDQ